MNGKLLGSVMLTVCMLSVFIGCSNQPDTIPQKALSAPSGTHPTAISLIHRGNERFAEGRWGAAKALYEEAVTAQPELAEAHYNLALALEKLGDSLKAKQHYIEAANLAPGHKTIWNSPPLRRYGNVPDKPRENTSSPVLPGIGGGGGLGGAGLGGAGS